jgi:hypothetical protein
MSWIKAIHVHATWFSMVTGKVNQRWRRNKLNAIDKNIGRGATDWFVFPRYVGR